MGMRMSVSLKTLTIATSTFACAALLSFGQSPQGGVSLSVDKAQAYTRVVVRPYLHGSARQVGSGVITGHATAAGLIMRSATALFAIRAP